MTTQLHIRSVLVKGAAHLSLKLVFRALFFALTIVTSRQNARAQETDTQLWLRNTITLQTRSGSRLFIEVQPRIGDELHRSSQFVLRVAAGRPIGNGWTAWLGYVSQPTFFPKLKREEGAMLQLTNDYSKGNLENAQRFRLEFRSIEGVDGLSHRMRYQLKHTHWLDSNRRWGWSTAQETAWNLDGSKGGPSAGLDQIRMYFGGVFGASRSLRFELGYLMVYGQNPYPKRDRRLDVLFLNTQIRL